MSSVNCIRSLVALEDVVQARLVDRDLARAQALDPLGNDVADHDLVTEIGEARPRDEADVSRAEHADLCHGPAYFPSGWRPLAIASIVSFDSSSRRVFTTQ